MVSWRAGVSGVSVSSYDGDLLLPVLEAVGLFISVDEECEQEDALAVILLVGFFKVAGQPLCEQNPGLVGPLA